VIDQCADIISIDMVQSVAMTNISSSLKDQVNAFEESLLRSKLQEHEGKVGPVLDDLKIERRTFNQKLNRYAISASEFKKNKPNT
jgi:DNA-binding NtrC family response regulator